MKPGFPEGTLIKVGKTPRPVRPMTAALNVLGMRCLPESRRSTHRFRAASMNVSAFFRAKALRSESVCVTKCRNRGGHQ